MATIDTSYFQNELALPGIETPAGSATMEILIAEKEDEVLTKLFGYEFYAVYKTGIAGNVQIYKDIQDGKVFTNGAGRPDQWTGLAYTVGTAKKSLIANYVYCAKMRDDYSISTTGGEKKTSNQVNVSPDHKIIRAWNEMVKWNFKLHEFLMQNITTYPAYQYHQQDSELFTLRNSLDI